MNKLLIFVGFVTFAVLSTVAAGWAIATSWGLLAVPLWDMPEVRIIEAIAAAFLVKLPFVSSMAKAENVMDEKKDLSEKVGGYVAYGIIAPLIMVAFAWIYSLFI